MVSSAPRGSVEEGASFRSPLDSTFDLPLAPPKTKKPWVLLVVLAVGLIAIVDVGAFLADPPRIRMFEANLCLSY
jgi:hypothetical protein